MSEDFRSLTVWSGNHKQELNSYFISITDREPEWQLANVDRKKRLVMLYMFIVMLLPTSPTTTDFRQENLLQFQNI